MRKADLLGELQTVSPALADGRRAPLPHAVHRQDGGLLERGGEKGTGRMALVMVHEDDRGARTPERLPDLTPEKQLRRKPRRHGRREAGEPSWRVGQIGFQQPLELHQRLVVEGDVVDIRHLEAGGVEAVLHRLLRKAGIKLDSSARETAFIGDHPDKFEKLVPLVKEIDKYYEKYAFCGIPVTVINHSCDTRYDDELLSTHDKKMIPCVKAQHLRDVWNESNEMVQKSVAILINEGQFFDDLYDCVFDMLRNGKKVYVCGLDGDFQRNKFAT